MKRWMITMVTAAMALAGCALPTTAGGGFTATATSSSTPQQPRASGRDPAPPAQFCRSHIDCGSGEFCKDRGDGMKVCMGNGTRGDSCANHTDCGSAMFCKDRGDGMKVCM